MQNKISSYEYFKRNAIDFTLFNDCLPARLGFTDIDGIMERRGSFLVLEKKFDASRPGLGQLIMFRQLVKLEKFTVCIFGGTEFDVQYMYLLTRAKEKYISEPSLDKLKKLIRDWLVYAENKDKSGAFEWEE